MIFVQIEIMLPHCTHCLFVCYKNCDMLSTENTKPSHKHSVNNTHNIYHTVWINWNDMMKRYIIERKTNVLTGVEG